MQKFVLLEECHYNKNPKYMALVQQTVKIKTNIQG